MPEVEEYTIGWICALTKELIAAKAFLDVLHDPVDNAAINDDNNYTLGSIGKHNVVIAVLPYGQYGLVNAAAGLKDMTRTFSNLRAVLMVGIGGGVPGTEDIRLGDIVVGSVGRNNSGVIQYDYGRAVQGKEFAVTGHLNQPPMAFLTAMSALHATYEMEGHSIQSNIDKALRKYKRLEKKYERPAASTDRLYEANFVHGEGEGIDCNQSCGDDNLLHRDERGDDESNPAIHCGLIASGNSLMKDALLRDKLAAKHGILCFEMEAAGLMNHFPCVVIRGICDYSDSHKNNDWQGYAAMVAAAYAKDLLLQVAPSSLLKEERIESLLRQLHDKVEDIYQITSESKRYIKSLSSSIHDDAISKWLNAADPSVDHNKAHQTCHPGTGQWLLNNPRYRTWKSQNGSFLWLNGNSGTGKSILSSIIIESLRSSPPPGLGGCTVLYFYITFTDSRKRSLDAILRSFISQLYSNRQESRHPITSLYSKYGCGNSQATLEQLKSTFREMMSAMGEVFIVIDALDEYQNRRTRGDDLFSWIQSLCNELVNTHILVTSRPESDIKTFIEAWADSESIISLITENVGRDISEYVRDVVNNSTSFCRWHGHTLTLDNIVNTLTTKADGVFRWVALQLERLKDCINSEEVNTTLQTLPTTLHETYHRALNNLTSTRKKYVIRILQFLAYSDIELELEAAVDALTVDVTAPPGSRFTTEDRMPLPVEISSLCSTLFFAVSTTQHNRLLGRPRSRVAVLQLAHSSVKDFILSCPKNEFDGLLIESTARLTIIEICLIYFLEMDYSLLQEDLIRTHHLLAFAAETWRDEACCREPRLDTFSHLSIELFSNDSLFKRWRILVNKYPKGLISLSCSSPEQDQMFYASWSGDENCVTELLDSSATGDKTTWRLNQALLVASEFGHLGAVMRLLREGADVNAKGRVCSVLCSAVYGGHKDVIALLIQEGADVDAQEGIYDIASQVGRLDIVDLLISEGADVKSESDMATALYCASDHGRLDIVMYLVEKGADVNAQTCSGTALQAASASGHLDIVIFLLEKGADIDAHVGMNYNALQRACRSGHLDIVNHLLAKGADVNDKREEYNDPFIDYLYLSQPRPFLRPDEENIGRPLHLASYFGHSDIVARLVEEGADLNARGGCYGTATCAAASAGHFNIVKRLVEEGADMNSPAGHYEDGHQAAPTSQQSRMIEIFQRSNTMKAYNQSLY
ncbi:uncharacterized protein LW94_2878 [Fusarium fujikuroi]|nr:uncharacterized protein LW94_2878 [Fusarium fujikuroi]